MRDSTKFSFQSICLFFGTFCLTFWGCFPRYFNVPKGDIQHQTHSDHFMGGSAEVDITQPPASSMGGFGSDIGQISRGNFGRLYAKSTYFEDSSGHYIIIVACDLWTFPQGLGDRVMAQLKKNGNVPFDIARENVLFAATHTHHSTGNYSTSIGYNLGSSTVEGFHKEQFKFLIEKITQSIENAISVREPIVNSSERWI